MSIGSSLLPEFDQEAEATRSVLERIPEEKLDWRPHEKSMPMARLAGHIAELPGWTSAILEQDELDMAPPDGPTYEPVVAESVAEILSLFDENMAGARERIGAVTDEALLQPWSLLRAGETLFSAPRIGVLRRMILNHLIHHRGQLTVYLRLVGAAVPSTFGPTADEPGF
ncbi:MAG: DinB family protein [Gemmatimonadota bacterium]